MGVERTRAIDDVVQSFPSGENMMRYSSSSIKGKHLGTNEEAHCAGVVLERAGHVVFMYIAIDKLPNRLWEFSSTKTRILDVYEGVSFDALYEAERKFFEHKDIPRTLRDCVAKYFLQ